MSHVAEAVALVTPWSHDKYHIQSSCRGYSSQRMDSARKITVEVPQKLLERALQASGTGVTQTVRAGRQLVAASQTHNRMRQFRGKVRFWRRLAELKADR